MQKGDSFALGSDARVLVDEPNARGAASVQGSGEVVHDKANVMDAGSTLGDEVADR